jgi:uncharacterized membrane protein
MERRWALLAIGFSVVLNIFLVGFLLAQLWSSHAPPDSEALAPREVLRQLAERLPHADAEHLRRAFASRRTELAAARREARAASERVRADIGAVPFDSEKMRADLDAAHAARDKVRPLIEQALLEALPQMSEEGRRVLGQTRLVRRRTEP